MRSEITYLSLAELLFFSPELGRIKPASEFHQMEGYVAWVVSRKLKLNPLFLILKKRDIYDTSSFMVLYVDRNRTAY